MTRTAPPPSPPGISPYSSFLYPHLALYKRTYIRLHPRIWSLSIFEFVIKKKKDRVVVADDKSGRWRRAEWVSYQQGPLARYKCWGEARAAVLRHVGPARARPVTDSCASRRRALSWRPSRLPRRPAVATLGALPRTQREDRSTRGQRWWVEYIITSFKVSHTWTINLIKTYIKTKIFLYLT